MEKFFKSAITSPKLQISPNSYERDKILDIDNSFSRSDTNQKCFSPPDIALPVTSPILDTLDFHF